ncbi:MAG: hypothetical protein RLZZ519_2134 [Bacteroidota bacterium]|jgi:hypothetical protein
METVWKFASRLFTVSFPAFLLGTLFSERDPNALSAYLAVGLAWLWFAAAGLVFVVGWYAIFWRPIPGSAWKAFVFITANVVFLGIILLGIATRGQGFGSAGILG